MTLPMSTILLSCSWKLNIVTSVERISLYLNLVRINQRNRSYREHNREWLNSIKSQLKCSICGEDRIWCLDFHHTNPSEKEGSVSACHAEDVSSILIICSINWCIGLMVRILDCLSWGTSSILVCTASPQSSNG